MVTSWITVAKPSATTSVITNVYTGGDPIGLLLALTYSSVTTTSVIADVWTTIPKPTTPTSWITVNKAT